MRKAIERVIAELEKKRNFSDECAEQAVKRQSLYLEGLNNGRADAYEVAMKKLKAVLAEYDDNRSISDSREADGCGTDDATEQMEG